MPMRLKNQSLIENLPEKPGHPVLQAYVELCQLKNLYRQGWLQRGLPEQNCETVADHVFATTLLAMWLSQADFPHLDLCKILQLCLIHELGEIYAGDITPADGISPAEKHRLEAESVRVVVQKLPAGERYLRLWEEYETGATPEARFVRQVDRLEMGLQAWIYQKNGFSRMDEFLESARQALEAPALIDFFESI